MGFLRHLPNLISTVRLMGIPVLLWMLYALEPNWLRVTAVFFLILALTDLLDGYLARKLNAVSDFGALLDPLVDKLLIIAPLIYMIELRTTDTGQSWVPAWLVVLLVARELWITGLRGFAITKGVVLSASDLGKAKTFFQVLAVFFLILHDEQLFRVGESWITTQYVGMQCLLTAVLIGYWSGAEYTLSFLLGRKRTSGEGGKPTPLRLKQRAF